MLPCPQRDFSPDDLLRGDLQLASPPQIIVKINQLFDDKTKTMRDVGAIIENDPGLAARLLKIVNSAFYGVSSKIISIRRAVALLGIREIRCLVLATVVIEQFSTLPGGLLSMREFWAFSVRSALFAKALASRQGGEKHDEPVFVCALLHDIGRLIFYRRIPDLARQAGLLATSMGIDEIEAEKRVIGFDHYEAGARLARLWNLPEIIAATMGNHSQPEKAGEYAEEAAIVSLASWLSMNTPYEPAMRKETAKPFPISPSPVHLPEADIDSLKEEVDAQFDVTFKMIFPA